VEKIHFNNLGQNKIIHIALIFALLCLLFGGLEIINFRNPKINKIILFLGEVSLVISLADMQGLFYKNSVNWNNKGMNIRIKSFFGTDIKFSQVNKAELQGDELVVYEKSNKKRIDLSKISQKDREKLLSIILEHIEE